MTCSVALTQTTETTPISGAREGARSRASADPSAGHGEVPDVVDVGRRPLVTVVPDWLRFGDVNPFTGTPYARSLFGELPGYAAHVVTGVLDLTPWVWDALVRSGEAAEVAGHHSYYRVTDWLAWVAQRQTRPAREWECADCWGTCVTFDPDGSMTGTHGTPVLCWCAQGRIGRWPDDGPLRGEPGRGVFIRTAGAPTPAGCGR